MEMYLCIDFIYPEIKRIELISNGDGVKLHRRLNEQERVMERRYVACWCRSWPEDEEPRYDYSTAKTLLSAKRIARAKANQSPFPDFAEVYEEIHGDYGWDRDTTHYATESGWEEKRSA